MLASHVGATRRRVRGEAVVLAVQDTTSLDYTGHPATTGLGVLNDAKHQGFLVHTTLAITPERVEEQPLIGFVSAGLLAISTVISWAFMRLGTVLARYVQLRVG